MNTMIQEIKRSQKPPPEPKKPHFDPFLHALSALALFGVAQQEGYIAVGLFGVYAFALYLHWERIKEYKADHLHWQVHKTGWLLHRSREWLEHFQREGRDGPPWFDNSDPKQWVEFTQSGVTNWQQEVERLEAQLHRLLAEQRQ